MTGLAGNHPETEHNKWYLVDHDRDNVVVRGPFDTASIASAVRTELERRGYYSENGNLWIVPSASVSSDG